MAAVVLSPIPVSPGGTVTVKGTGFGWRWWATIYLDGAQVARAQSSTTGEFTASFAMPANALDVTHSVRAKTRWRDVTVPLKVAIAPPPDPAPVIAGIEPMNVKQTTAELIWHVSENAQAWAEYGPTTAYGTDTKHETSFDYQDHHQWLSHLVAGTTYHYRIHVIDSAGHHVISPDHTFSTLPVAVPAPTPVPTPVPVPVPPPPPDPKPGTGPLIGVGMGEWAGAGVIADVKGCVRAVSVAEKGSSAAARVKAFLDAGFDVTLVLTGQWPYNKGGIRAVNAADVVARAVAAVKANPALWALEVLNEPGGQWFWGSDAENPANAAAFVRIVKAVHDALAGIGSKVKVLASYDGGHPGSTKWAAAMVAADPKVWTYADGWTVHPYGGASESQRAASGLGLRGAATEAATRTGKPVHLTEIGWPTAVGKPATGDSLQWTEAAQAANIVGLIKWARAQPNVVASIDVFMWADFGSNMWYGITGLDGKTRKVAYGAMAAIR